MMKRSTFVGLLPIEALFALIAAGLLFSDVGAVIYLIAAAVYAVVLAPFFLCLKKATDEGKRRKIRRNIILVLLIPILAGVIAIATVVAVLMIMFW